MGENPPPPPRVSGQWQHSGKGKPISKGDCVWAYICMASQSVVGTAGALPSHDYSTRQTERREGVKCTGALREEEVLQVLHTMAYQGKHSDYRKYTF